MGHLYKYFINGDIRNKVVEEIMNNLDFKLVKKFEASKEIYKNILMKHAIGE